MFRHTYTYTYTYMCICNNTNTNDNTNEHHNTSNHTNAYYVQLTNLGVVRGVELQHLKHYEADLAVTMYRTLHNITTTGIGTILHIILHNIIIITTTTTTTTLLLPRIVHNITTTDPDPGTISDLDK